MKDVQEKRDWFEVYNEANKLQSDSIDSLLYIANGLKYTFPAISNDLYDVINDLDKSKKMYHDSMQSNMSSSLDNSKKLIGAMFTGLLNKED